MQPSRLWIALTRPDNLVTALVVAAASRERFARCHLLHENSNWWQKVDLAACPALFDEVHRVDKVPTCRGLRDLPRLHRGLKNRQEALRALEIAPSDTIVTLAGITELSAALASAYPGVGKLLCTTVKKYHDASRPYSFARYRPTTAGWLRRRVLEPRLGLRRTVHLKPWRGGGDGVRLDRLEEPLERVFGAILLLSNDGTEKPATAGANVQASPFPSLHDLRGWLTEPEAAHGRPGKVVFFGTPFLLVRNLPPEVYRERLNVCLDGLRRWYGAACELVYRPHPAETGEPQMLDLRDFVIEDDRQVAELYFLQNFRRIAAVFSVSSTVSRVALNYGLNGYALWHCFPFDETAARYFRSLMGRVPPEFEVHTLDRPPTIYANPRDAAPGRPTFLQVLDGMFDRSQPVGSASANRRADPVPSLIPAGS